MPAEPWERFHRAEVACSTSSTPTDTDGKRVVAFGHWAGAWARAGVLHSPARSPHRPPDGCTSLDEHLEQAGKAGRTSCWRW